MRNVKAAAIGTLVLALCGWYFFTQYARFSPSERFVFWHGKDKYYQNIRNLGLGDDMVLNCWNDDGGRGKCGLFVNSSTRNQSGQAWDLRTVGSLKNSFLGEQREVCINPTDGSAFMGVIGDPAGKVEILPNPSGTSCKIKILGRFLSVDPTPPPPPREEFRVWASPKDQGILSDWEIVTTTSLLPVNAEKAQSSTSETPSADSLIPVRSWDLRSKVSDSVNRAPSNSIIDLDKSIFGMPMGASEDEVFERNGAPMGYLRIKGDETAMIYGKTRGYLFKSGKLEGILVANTLTDPDLADSMGQSDSLTQHDDWELTNGLKSKMTLEDARKVLGDNLSPMDSRVRHRQQFMSQQSHVKLFFAFRPGNPLEDESAYTLYKMLIRPIANGALPPEGNLLRYKKPAEANSVEIRGSFDNWTIGHKLTPSGGNATISELDVTMLNLAEGKHEYKFLVDGTFEQGRNRMLSIGHDGGLEQ